MVDCHSVIDPSPQVNIFYLCIANSQTSVRVRFIDKHIHQRLITYLSICMYLSIQVIGRIIVLKKIESFCFF